MLTRPMDNLYNNFSQYVSNPILLYPILPYHIPTYCIAIQTKLSQSVQTGIPYKLPVLLHPTHCLMCTN